MSEAGDNPSPAEDLEDLYENAPCGYLSLLPDGRVVKANRTFAAWSGYAPDELIGLRVHDLLNIAGRIFYETHFAPLLRMQGSFNEVALSFVAKDGSSFPALVNATERKDAEDRLLFIRLTIFNATDRRRYERELVSARETAETARRDLQAINQALEQRQANMETSLRSVRKESELREQFIAVLGHDLRNPLAAISAAARMLERRGLSSDAAEIVHMMHGSVTRMAGLIDDIMDFAKARLGGGITLHIDDGLGLETALSQVVAELLSTAPERIIESHLSLDRPVPCDSQRIGQMVSNLLGNALTHGAEGRPIRLRASTTAREFELSVANEGAPIAPEAMDKLFQPFFRGEVQPSKQGLGLGLYIAAEIARAHDGRLTVASTADETRFTFKMPLPESEARG